MNCQGGGRPAPPPPSYFLGVSKEVIKYLVSVTAHQLLTLLIFDTFVNFNKYYKMSVSKLERVSYQVSCLEDYSSTDE